MTSTDTEAAPAPRFVIGSAGADELVVADGTPMPKAVHAANDAARDAIARREQAYSEHRAAIAEANAAPGLDLARDRAAVAAGAPLPAASDRVGPAAQEALATAKRRAKAADAHARDALFALAKAIWAERPTWLPEVRATVAEIRGGALAQVDELAATLVRLAQAEALADGLAAFEQGALTGVRLSVTWHLPDVTADLREHIRGPQAGENTLISSGLSID